MHLAWLHWNPPRFIFTLPFIHHPIAWYGVCFAIGFILGFFIILPMIRQKLSQTEKISPRDIASWPHVVQSLRQVSGKKEHPLYPIYQKLSQKTRENLNRLKIKQEPVELTKNDILQAINHSYLAYGREKLEKLFGKGLLTLKELAVLLTDRLTWYIVIGTVVGARLGHVFFYEWPRYQQNPLEIIKVWEGGLASHGGALGVILALFLYQRSIREKFPEFNFLCLLDILCVPTAMTAVWIRIGNFMNQEIIGPVTTAPWAVVFAHPLEAEGGLPRHPTQLYEAFCYLITFIFLYTLWSRKRNQLKPGVLIGLFMILVFGSRFFVEFVKVSKGLMIDESFLLTGQYLSLPFIILGIFLLFCGKKLSKSSIF
ncbi:prolipoprotein diacylglyceryl transferase [Waddlia chondrophila 2032/99]|uniref:Phosphatidylglycerol--prolipoprotein diacylglyceryl transferase n=1 Tax=Waddlia chondrophila 2032/99 TaxID=765953 RepID=F8LDH4_9BACT|nr:prolipoprotein diacylglyceryl transferase [Waddlia chondrophila 2032/99]